jgi:hypothetical protein
MMSQRRGEEVVGDDDEGGGLKQEKRSEGQVDSKNWRTLGYKQSSLIYQKYVGINYGEWGNAR